MTTPAFTDHFGGKSRSYAEFRPGYPPALFEWLASQCAARELAWDCGAGTGQASVALAAHFRRVLATDASAGQIAAAEPHPGVEYRVAPAQASGLPDASADLVTVAQALHWFDLDGFHAEVRRVAKPGALLAVWSYGIVHLDGPGLDAPMQDFYRNEIGPYWPPERRHVETGYRDLPFPFPRIEAPAFEMRVEWTLEQLLGYLRTWSACTRYEQARGRDPVLALARRLAPAWGDPQQRQAVRWPLSLKAGRCVPER